jgi:ParB-like chromosome segregation protein Spo0J
LELKTNIIMENLHIHQELAELAPALLPDDKEALIESLLREGLRDPILYIEGKDGKNYIIDGHNRWAICTHYGLKMSFKKFVVPDGMTAKEWVLLNQLSRRNLDDWGKSFIAEKLEVELRLKAKKRQKTSTGGITPQLLSEITKAAYGENDEDDPAWLPEREFQKRTPIHSRKEAAKIVGISSTTHYRAKVIRKKGSAEIKEKLDKGEIKITPAYNEVTNKPKPKPKPPADDGLDWEGFYDAFIKWLEEMEIYPNRTKACKPGDDDGEQIIIRTITCVKTKLRGQLSTAEVMNK